MKFSIIATSDIHGHTERFSQLATMIQARRPALLIDNGDFLQGSHLSFYYENYLDEKHPQITLANKLRYDLAVFGNHEFNYPLKTIEAMRAACQFEWIAANIKDFAKPFFIKEVHGIRIAVIGVVTHYTALWDEGEATKSLCFEDAFLAAQRTVKFVREHEQVQLVILSYHGGFERNIETGDLIDIEIGENQAYQMLQEIDGIDIFITGHQHLEIASKFRGVSVVQPGSNGKCFAQIDITIEDKHISHMPSLVYVDTSIEQVNFPSFNEWKNEVLGIASTNLIYEDFFTPRLQATTYTQFVHNMQLHYTNAQLSVIELPYHSHGGFPEKITRKDVLHNISRQNRLQVIQLNGLEIRQAIELSASVFAINSQGAIDFSMNVYFPEPQPYTYDIWGGIDYEITLSNPVGKRLTKLQYGNQDIQDEDVFEVVVNSYRATGAHQFTMFKKTPIRETTLYVPHLMMQYILQTSPIQVEVNNHFQLKK
ncbi:5'-nucleotidase C-terminal domain-containing protein [Solibacillus sp. FSL R7-0682]|uniref:bifunctional metallophosphatase/5'-nucleotidase n=1 Tax=Solibacillus sp. FSL R7-0682 TaxID=2921690 RepID=UPI0030FB858D